MALELYKPEEATRSRGGIAVMLAALLGYGIFSLYEFLGIGFWQQDLIGGALGDEFPISPRLILCLLATLGMAGGIFWLLNLPKVVDFVIETEAEMTRVSWASKQEVISSSIVVLVTVVVLSIYLYAVDIGLEVVRQQVPWDALWSRVLGG